MRAAPEPKVQRFWILDPRGHREVEGAQMREYAGPDDILIIPPADEWVCDDCNDTIDPDYPIAVDGSYAICPRCACANRQAARDGESLTDPDPSWWADDACGCRACLTTALRWVALVEMGEAHAPRH